MYDLDVPNMETERLYLRETKPSDFVDMYEYASLPYIGPLAGWEPHKKLGDTRTVLKLFNDKKLYGQLGTVAIVLKENNKMIGTVELHSYISEYKAELGFTLNPNYWGKGIAFEASREVLKWGFDKLKLKRIECNTYVTNHSSKRVIEKLGFTYEGIRRKGYQLYDGTLHDILAYSLTDDEYYSAEYQRKVYGKEE